jgi:hypothetical protein
MGYISTCSRTYTKARWTTNTIYGKWTCECTKHKCITEGEGQWTTSKWSQIGCVKIPILFSTIHHINTTHINPTMGSECSPWWQSWTCKVIWWSYFHKITMVICNPKILFTQNRRTHNLVPTNLEVEWLQLLNRLEHFHHIDQRPSNQSVSILNLEFIKPRARSTIV